MATVRKKTMLKILILIVSSFIATLLPLPFPVVEGSLLTVLDINNTILWYGAIAMLVTITDTIFGVITYLLSGKLSHLVIRSEKRKQQLENIHEKLKGQAPFWLFVAGATPFPFTLTIYASAVIKYDLRKFVILMFFSRLVKYGVIVSLWGLGYNILTS